MANYLNGSLRGLQLGLQFIQNQDRITAEKAMQVERIRANDLQLDKRIAADAASQGRTIAFQDRQLEENGRQFDITNNSRMSIFRAELGIAERGMTLEEEAAPSKNALRLAQAGTLTAQIGENARKLDQADRALGQVDTRLELTRDELAQNAPLRAAQAEEVNSGARVNDENVRVSQEASVNEMDKALSAEDREIGMYIAQIVTDRYGGDVDAAAKDPRFQQDFVSFINRKPGTSLHQFQDRVLNPRWELVDGRMVVRGENKDTGEPTLLTANGLNMFETSDPPLEADAGDAMFGFMAVAHASGMPTASALRNISPANKPKVDTTGVPTVLDQVKDWMKDTGLSNSTFAQVDAGGLAMINGARQGDYTGPPMVVAGAEVAPPEVDPESAEGKELGKLRRQLEDAEKRNDTGRAEEVQKLINVVHGHVRAASPQPAAAAPAPAPAPAPAAAPVDMNTKGVLRAPPPPLSRNLGYDTGALRNALGAQQIHGTGEAVQRAADGMRIVPETTTDYNNRLITAGINPNNGGPVNTQRDPNLMINPTVTAHTDFRLSNAFDLSTLGQAPWKGGKAAPAATQSQFTKNYQALKPAVIQFTQTPEFYESFRDAQTALGKPVPEDLNQWDDATMTQAVDFAFQIMPHGKARQVKHANGTR